MNDTEIEETEISPEKKMFRELRNNAIGVAIQNGCFELAIERRMEELKSEALKNAK